MGVHLCLQQEGILKQAPDRLRQQNGRLLTLQQISAVIFLTLRADLLQRLDLLLQGLRARESPESRLCGIAPSADQLRRQNPRYIVRVLLSGPLVLFFSVENSGLVIAFESCLQLADPVAGIIRFQIFPPVLRGIRVAVSPDFA